MSCSNETRGKKACSLCLSCLKARIAAEKRATKKAVLFDRKRREAKERR